MSIENLKEEARRHEQKEEWQKSLDLYLKAIALLDDEEQPDIGLYNRVGDLYTRLDNMDAAVQNYERAIDLYMEAELPNNAIAICKKVLRNLASKASVYLKMGQIRAAQGFLPDARQNFLMYADLKMQGGEVEEAFRALVEFADLAPSDTEIRVAIAEQMVSRDRADEGVEQFLFAYRKMQEQGRADDAEQLGNRILEVDPGADLSAPEPAMAAPADEGDGDDFAIETTALGGFGDTGDDDDGGLATDLGGFEIGGLEDESPEAEEEVSVEVGGDFDIGGVEGDGEDAEGDSEFDESAFDMSGLETATADDLEDEPEEDDSPLPTMDFGEVAFDDEPEEDDSPLPTMDFDDEPEEEAEPLPTLDLEMDVDAVPADNAVISEAVETAMEEAVSDSATEDEEEEEWQPLSDEELAAQDEPAMEGGPAWPGAPMEGDEGDGETGDLVEQLRARLEREPGDAEGWLALGQELFNRDDATGANVAMDHAHKAFASMDDLPRAMQVVRELILQDSENVDHHQRLVEYAFQSNDRTLLLPAYLELAECLSRNGEPVRAQAVFQQVLNIDPNNLRAQEGVGVAEAPAEEAAGVASSSDYVDLGSLILDDDSEKTTRWTVTAEAPSGDEDADFAKMLAQFKEKVAANLESDDVKAHYDLGTAYKEMGLVDEAVSEFQQALRADPGHLPSYELLGQCFLDLGQPDVAIRSLNKALESEFEIEDELLAIYYHLGRAHESVGDSDEAKDYYEKVFALDINFMDVTDRLRELR
jgi:tetratricopeptide (TPR) repeat protein